jgi:UDP-N-acetylmuramate--alanine ligase
MLEAGGTDPTIINGGIIHAYGTNTRMGAGDWMVVESDESDGSFNRLPTTVAVVTNIDPEHMDHYGSFDAVRAAYRNFIEQIPFYGFAVLCADHAEVRALSNSITDRRIFTYGFAPDADVRAENLRADPDGVTFDVSFAQRLINAEDRYVVRDLRLPMMGEHNVQNACAALTIAAAFGFDDDVMRGALGAFQGVKRRFTKTGVAHGITVIDDYGHHPVEIRAVLKAGQQALANSGGRIIAVVQPHRYSRLASLFPEFCAAFDNADAVIVADVYAAGETPIAHANRDALVSGIRAHGHTQVQALDTPENLAKLVADIARAGDMVICLGAGTITAWAHDLPAGLDALLSPPRGAAHA